VKQDVSRYGILLHPGDNQFLVQLNCNVDSKKISPITATNIVIANMIGTGLFTSLGFQVQSIQSNFALISLWLIGGCLALCGALCYAELAATFQQSGGEYLFLSRIYHPALGFMAGWISATVGFAAPIALSAMAFGHYFVDFTPMLSPMILSLIAVCMVTGIHLAGIRVGEIFQNIATTTKLLLILALLIAGCFFAHRQPLHLWPHTGSVREMFSGSFAIALFFVLYSFSGWNAATYITGEVRNPAKNVPWALFSGTVLVTIIYTLVNGIFLLTTPKAAFAGKEEVGKIVGSTLFGQAGGQIISLLISLGLVASISAMTWIGPRVSKIIADDMPVFRFFGLTLRNGTPYVAMLFQLAVTTFLILTGTFKTVLLYIQFSLTLCSFLAVLGLILFRLRQPDYPRPYKVWGYPVTPIIFLGSTFYIMIVNLIRTPVQSIAGLLTALAGLIIYFLFARNKPTPPPYPKIAEVSQRSR
jgi:basic amino acid/polyamine antiporter, APA family